jgi:hypothetical protein
VPKQKLGKVVYKEIKILTVPGVNAMESETFFKKTLAKI